MTTSPHPAVMAVEQEGADGPPGVTRGVAGRLPYLAAGAGAPLVFLAGLSPEAGVDSKTMQRVNVASVKPLAAQRRVLFFNRRPGLPTGMPMDEIASEHAHAIRAALGQAVDVLGVSTGGSIAQQLAADHPDVVRRLVLISTACRLGPGGRMLQRRVAAHIRRGANRRALAVMTGGLVPPRRGRIAASAAAWLIAPRLSPNDDLADMATTIEAEDAFDLARCRNPISAPTLILAGGKDPFYSPALFAETARLIPSSRLRVFAARGHITVTTHPETTTEVQRFLDTTTSNQSRHAQSH
jgi:pimeloyl-ACP methyl ester carboxylesterase